MALPDAQSSAYFHTRYGFYSHSYALTNTRPSICRTLCDTIDDLICAGRIEPQLGAKILRKFVPSFEKAFAENVKAVVNMKVQFPIALPSASYDKSLLKEYHHYHVF